MQEQQPTTADSELQQLSITARRAIPMKGWPTVDACAREILRRDPDSAEGWFLAGLVAKTRQTQDAAIDAFSKALDRDAARYDAAIELANQFAAARLHGKAVRLIDAHVDKLSNSPLYLNMAGMVYSGAGLPDRAWPLFERADALQPGIDLFQANMATCAFFLGRLDDARRRYRDLLQRHPTHQRYHYQLAQLGKAPDSSHVDEMKAVIEQTKLPPDRNIFMYYAIGKELEDLEQWQEAFRYYRMAGDAVASVAKYDVSSDVALIDTFISVCNADWLREGASSDTSGKTPIFVVGLPRTGTTLTERIIASHSNVRSVDETQFMQMVIRRVSNVDSEEKMTPEMVEAAAKLDPSVIRDGYLELVDYKLGEEPMFADKLPFNVFYLGFIAKAWPAARIVVVNRNPMDSCFAMYKHVFTWAYKFSYTLEGLGTFYPAYRRLLDHWRATLGDRIVEIDYEKLVTNQQAETRRLLDRLGLDFEDACLNFEKNTTATLTASAAQVREKVHSRSVDRWKHYEAQLEPLRTMLENAGIPVS